MASQSMTIPIPPLLDTVPRYAKVWMEIHGDEQLTTDEFVVSFGDQPADCKPNLLPALTSRSNAAFPRRTTSSDRGASSGWVSFTVKEIIFAEASCRLPSNCAE